MLINQTVYFKFEEIRLTFLTGHSDDSKKRIRQLIVQQLCEATAGPLRIYHENSRDGLGITEMCETLR